MSKIAGNVFLAEGSRVIGDVEVGEESSVWFNAVIRGDHAPIRIGKRSNVQDNAVLHGDFGFPVTIGNDVTIGHTAIVHGCTVGDNTIIGMGAVVLNGAEIGKNCIIGAGALVTGGTRIPDGSLAVGSPAKVRRSLTEAEIAGNAGNADDYCRFAEEYRSGRRD